MKMEEEQNLYTLIKSSKERLLSIQNDRLRERIKHIESTMPHYNSIVQGIATWLETRHENKYCFFQSLKEDLFDPELSGDYSADDDENYVGRGFFVDEMRTTKNILAVHRLFSGDTTEVTTSIGLALRKAGFTVQLLWYNSWRRGMDYACYDWFMDKYGDFDVKIDIDDIYDSGIMIFIDART